MQFYKDCGITDAAVSQWRKGKTNPAMTTISRISEYLEVSVAYLLGEEEQKEKPTLQTESELSPIKQEAWELIQKMDEETLKRFIAGAKAILGVN